MSYRREYRPYGIVEPVPKNCPLYQGGQAKDGDLSGQLFELCAPAFAWRWDKK